MKAKIEKGVKKGVWRPDKIRILEEVCKAYDTTSAEIMKMRRGEMNEACNIAIYLSRKLRRETLKEIGLQFNIDKDSTVSSVMARVKKRLEKDRKFNRRLDEIVKAIQTS